MSFEVIFTFLAVAALGIMYMIYDAYERRTKVLIQMVQVHREKLDHSRLKEEKKVSRTLNGSVDIPPYNPPPYSKYGNEKSPV